MVTPYALRPSRDLTIRAPWYRTRVLTALPGMPPATQPPACTLRGRELYCSVSSPAGGHYAALLATGTCL